MHKLAEVLAEEVQELLRRADERLDAAFRGHRQRKHERLRAPLENALHPLREDHCSAVKKISTLVALFRRERPNDT